MLYNCYNTRNIDLSFFDTRNVITMERMLYGCDNIEIINLSTFET